MGKLLPELVIVKDRREQKGWDFDPEEKTPGKIRVKGTVWGTLDAADYAIQGYDNLIRIERKAGVCELFGNMLPKSNRERFEREMEKLRSVKYKYIVVEDNLSNDLMGMSIPQLYKGPPGHTVFKWLTELQMEYGITTIFAGNAGKRVARSLFDTAIRRELKCPIQ